MVEIRDTENLKKLKSIETNRKIIETFFNNYIILRIFLYFYFFQSFW